MNPNTTLDNDADAGQVLPGGEAEDENGAEQAKAILERINEARSFDKNARKEYAFCRRYARGDSQFEVAVNLLGTYIDILVAFLYARDPDIDVTVAESVGPSRYAEVKLFAKTLELTLSHLWKKADMKRAAKRWLRSNLTIGIGWLKLGWQEKYQRDAAIQERARDVQENIALLISLNKQFRSGDYTCTTEELEQQIADVEAGLEANAEVLVYKGLFIDFVPGDDIQVSLDVQNVVDCKSASWMAQRFFMPVEKARAKYSHVKEDLWSSAARYRAVEPSDDVEKRRTPATNTNITDKSSERFTTGSSLDGRSSQSPSKNNAFVMGWEYWNAEDNLVYVVFDGLKALANKAPPEVATTRFFPFYPLATQEVDNERHPQSLVWRSYLLMDEYNSTRSGKKQLRARSKPKMAFDARKHTKGDIEKITNGTYGEWVPLKPLGDTPLDKSVIEVPYPKIDQELFNLQEVRGELETLWGIQEALTSGIQVAKTATEAEIQQAGTSARTGSGRDELEKQLTEIAQGSAEIAVQKMTRAEVTEICGTDAIWIEALSIQDIPMLVNVEIRAGSTGKPNTARDREAWSREAPLINAAIKEIGGLRMSSPLEIANCLEQVVAHTLEITGTRLDITQFMPQPGQPVPLVDPVTGQTVMAFPAPMLGAGGGAPGGAPGIPGAPAPGGAGPTPQDKVAPTALPETITEREAPQ